MSILNNLSGAALRQAANIKEKIEALQNEFVKVLNGATVSISISTTGPKKKGGMSAAGKAKIAAAQKLRWAKVNASKSSKNSSSPKGNELGNGKPAKKKGGMSAAAKAKIAAAQRARWAKVKAAKTAAK